ncbi:hypothetical protein KBK24_0105115 [Burkholderia sp. K24]|nr:hypothetical protein KBK24_0105115 [Burkholderia sp. K24]
MSRQPAFAVLIYRVANVTRWPCGTFRCLPADSTAMAFKRTVFRQDVGPRINGGQYTDERI